MHNLEKERWKEISLGFYTFIFGIFIHLYTLYTIKNNIAEKDQVKYVFFLYVSIFLILFGLITMLVHRCFIALERFLYKRENFDA